NLLWALFAPLVIKLALELPIRKPHRVRNAAALVAILPAIAVLRAVAGMLVTSAFFHSPITQPELLRTVRLWWHGNLVVLVLIVIVTNLLGARQEAAERQRHAAATRALLARVELDALRTQLQPHFVFTALDAIDRVLQTDAAKADAMVVLLADLLRGSLRTSDEEVPLGDELEQVDRYLELYRIAFEGRLVTTFAADEHAFEAIVPPMILQPVVEQAVIEVIEPSGGGTIAVDAGIETGIETGVAAPRLRIAVTCRASTEPWRAGALACPVHPQAPEDAPADIGLTATRRRLDSLFGASASVVVDRDVSGIHTTLLLPLQAREEAGAA
ncbi:MAG: sensor histidine kinase, partial [Acidobacteria bacterium]|nr:sensor histidine kinase [Acidobacteriota bacterium]